MNHKQIVTHTAMALLVVVLCTGCATVSLSQVKQFGMASSSLGEYTKKALELAATASVDRNIYGVAGDPNEGPSDKTFEGLFTGDIGVIDGQKKAERLALRLKLLEHLTSYSSALQNLVQADFSNDIDSSAKDLNGSLVGLRETYKKATKKDLPITDEGIGIISTAVNAIGKAVVESKRRAAIKSIIQEVDPAVQHTSALIASDLGQDSDLAEFVKAALSNSRGSVQQAYNLERVRPNSTFDDRYAMLVRARQLYEAEMATPGFFSAVSEGALAAGKAHKALRIAVDADVFSSTEAAKFIGELEVSVKSVKNYYKSIQTNN